MKSRTDYILTSGGKNAHAALIYRVRQDGCIIDAEGRIPDDLAAKDPVFAKGYSSREIVGENLFRFIQGETVRQVYRQLMERVLITGRTIRFPYRCDSGPLRREMEMILSRDGATVRYESLLIREVARPRPVPDASPGAHDRVSMCSFCKQYRFPAEQGLWKNLDLIFTETGLPEQFDITHGICDSCSVMWRKQLADSLAQ
jgi:hypothetical protein